ncbi:unnamed protein product [Ilex paraguariensis]|uniref:Uncharacterized protein n=1 Tax=Ilex paraguariensis TaxID=185542 RepID=A0ABC8SH74_9AQUA
MSDICHKRVGRSCHGMRGFRLKYTRKFSVQRLRRKFLQLFRLFNEWRSSYEHALKTLRSNISRSGSKNDKNSVRRKFLVKEVEVPSMFYTEYRFRSFASSKSFYSEAISECLEFIKRSSVSVDEEPVSHR